MSASGYRLYTDKDLLRLQQILALKFLGFSLSQIREFLVATPEDALESLRIQEAVMVEKRKRMDRVILAFQQARVAFSGSPEPDWRHLAAVIRVIQVEQESWRKYYSEEALEKIRKRGEHYTEADAARDSERWQSVIDGFKKAFAEGLDPAEDKVQDLVERYQGLILEFTQGDPGIAEGLEKMYRSPDNPYPSPFSEEEAAYVQRAIAVRSKTG